MSDLIEELKINGREYNFFQVLLLLEEYYQNYYNNSGHPWIEQLRLSADQNIGFPESDIAFVKQRDQKIYIALSFLGLMGVSSPLPHYFIEYGMKNCDEPTPLIDLLNIFDNRLYLLFYLAWSKYRPVPAFSQIKHFLYSSALSFAGYDSEDENNLECILPYLGLLAGTPRNASVLTEILNDTFDGVKVSIRQWSSRWVNIECGGLGIQLTLGDNAILGDRILDRSGKITLILELSKDVSIENFIPGSKSISKIIKIIDKYMQLPMAYDIEIKLKAENLSPVVLGANSVGLGLGTTYGDIYHHDEEYSMTIEENVIEMYRDF